MATVMERDYRDLMLLETVIKGVQPELVTKLNLLKVFSMVNDINMDLRKIEKYFYFKSLSRTTVVSFRSELSEKLKALLTDQSYQNKVNVIKCVIEIRDFLVNILSNNLTLNINEEIMLSYKTLSNKVIDTISVILETFRTTFTSN